MMHCTIFLSIVCSGLFTDNAASSGDRHVSARAGDQAPVKLNIKSVSVLTRTSPVVCWSDHSYVHRGLLQDGCKMRSSS